MSTQCECGRMQWCVQSTRWTSLGLSVWDPPPSLGRSYTQPVGVRYTILGLCTVRPMSRVSSCGQCVWNYVPSFSVLLSFSSTCPVHAVSGSSVIEGVPLRCRVQIIPASFSLTKDHSTRFTDEWSSSLFISPNLMHGLCPCFLLLVKLRLPTWITSSEHKIRRPASRSLTLKLRKHTFLKRGCTKVSACSESFANISKTIAC